MSGGQGTPVSSIKGIGDTYSNILDGLGFRTEESLISDDAQIIVDETTKLNPNQVRGWQWEVLKNDVN